MGVKAYSRHIITAAILLLVMAAWYSQIQPFNLIAYKLNDINFKLNDHPPHPDVLFVEIGEQSINRFGRWPWDREVLAEAIAPLQGAQALLLDMVFSEPTNQQSDQALSERFFQLENTVCSFFIRDYASQPLDDDVRWLLSDSSLERFQPDRTGLLTNHHIETNILSIQEGCSATAGIVTPLDADSLSRRYPLAFWFDGMILPSLGTEGLRNYLHQDLTVEDSIFSSRAHLGNLTIPMETDSVARLNFYQYESYQRIPLDDLVSGKVSPEAVNGKIVILGISEAGVTDIRTTPIGSIPGPLIHYTFVSNALDQILLQYYPFLDALLILLLTFTPLLILALLHQMTARLVCYFLVIFGYIALTKLLYVYSMVLIDTLYPLLGFTAMLLYHEFYRYRINEEENQFLADAFKSYVSGDLLKQLSQNPHGLALGGEERYVTLLFSDIRSFSTISENLSSQKLVQMLNAHFEPLTKAVIDNGGMLDKYIGDAIMAIFNAPVEIDNHARSACLAALEMVSSLHLNSDNPSPFRIGVGINTGNAVVGNMGSSLRFNYTAIGDTVNTASRLEGLCKEYRCHIIISDETVQHLDNSFIYRCLGPVYVKGKRNAVVIYELMLPGESTLNLKRDFDTAFAAFAIGQLEEAIHGFQVCIDRYEDATSEVFLERCQRLINESHNVKKA